MDNQDSQEGQDQGQEEQMQNVRLDQEEEINQVQEDIEVVPEEQKEQHIQFKEEEQDQLENQIDIVVSDPQSKQESQFNKYILYTIKGKDRAGQFEVQRRFNEFYAIREALFIRWPGCCVPRMPGKKMFQGSDPKVIDDRLKFLNAFCHKVAKLPHLFYSTEFCQIFLRSKDSDVSKTLQNIAKSTSVELIQKYQIHFGQLQGKDIDQNLHQSIQVFTTYIRKSLETLRNYKVFVKELVDNQEQLNQSLTYTITTQLPEYEKQCLRQYTGGNEDALLFYNSKNADVFRNTFNTNELFRSNNLHFFLDLIRLEIKDCKAFLQQIQIKEEFEQKRVKLEAKAKDLQIEYQNILQGKTSLKNIFQKGTTEDLKQRIQLQITETNNEIENTKVLNDIIAAILGFIEIDIFKKEKNSCYQSIMTTICDLEIQNIEQQMKFWECIQNQSSELLEQST